MKNAEICDFCEERESEGVFATDYAPVSLCYCKECMKVQNIRPIEIAIFGWARLGEKYFIPRVWADIGLNDDKTPYPPMVYCEGKYITVKELIENLTIEKINKWVKAPFRLKFCLEKFAEKINS